MPIINGYASGSQFFSAFWHVDLVHLPLSSFSCRLLLLLQGLPCIHTSRSSSSSLLFGLFSRTSDCISLSVSQTWSIILSTTEVFFNFMSRECQYLIFHLALPCYSEAAIAGLRAQLFDLPLHRLNASCLHLCLAFILQSLAVVRKPYVV